MRPLKRWEKNYCKSDDPEVIKSIFVKRHKRAGFLFITAFLGNPLLALFTRLVLHMSKDEYMNAGLFYFNLLLPIAAFYVMLRCRCPRCNAMPKSNQIGASGILLFPKKCWNCGAPLLPDHRWAQE